MSKCDTVVEEEEEEEDEPLPEGNDKSSVGTRFVWDAAKGMLVDADTAESKKNPNFDEGKDAGGNGSDVTPGNSDEENADDDESDDEEDTEANSRAAFLEEASTPELIKQAITVGGAMAESVSNRWVLDKVTELHFRFDTISLKMHCWNPGQRYMYIWKGRGKMEFVWAAPTSSDPNEPPPLPPAAAALPPPPGAVASSPETAGAKDKFSSSSGHVSCWITIIPPSMLEVGNARDPNAIVTEEVEVPSRALGQLIGAGHKGIKEMELHSGAKASVRARGEEESHAHMVFEGTRTQVNAAKAVLEQKLVLAIGAEKVERLRKHVNSEFLAKLKSESGSDAASGGVGGLQEFAQKWSFKAVLVRKLKKLDAMTQRYLIRHFKPMKAKPANALRSYVTTLLMPPQRWRLQALFEDGELDGEVCETAIVGEAGAVVGRQRPQIDQTEEDMEAFLSEVGEKKKQPKSNLTSFDTYELAPGEQLIELEFDSSISEREACQYYGDVQPHHCRFLRMGSDFYVWALESQIGTVIDGKKIRQMDGPTPIRDGTVVALGRYLLYCEVGESPKLQDRRKRLLAGESFWKIIHASLPDFRAQTRKDNDAKDGKDQGAPDGKDEQVEADSEEEEEEEKDAKVVDAGKDSDPRGVKRKKPEENIIDESMGDAIDFNVKVDDQSGSGEAKSEIGIAENPTSS